MTKDTEWNKACMKEYGRVLVGKHKHYCPDWDYLPIDETCKEFVACCCVHKEETK